jgi:hypothetical protein
VATTKGGRIDTIYDNKIHYVYGYVTGRLRGMAKLTRDELTELENEAIRSWYESKRNDEIQRGMKK